MVKYYSLLAVSALLTAGGSPQAEKWEITVETIDAAPQIDKQSERLTSYAAKGLALKSVPKESLEESAQRILEKDIVFMETLFKGDWDPAFGAVTVTIENADVLVAVWPPSLAYPRGAVLWDHPDFNLVLFEVDDALLGEPGRIREFLENAIKHSDSPLDFQEALFWLASDPGLAGVAGIGSVVYRNRPARPIKGHEYRIFAFRAETSAFIAFRCGKNLVTGTYQKGGVSRTTTIYEEGMVWVPERFPPLKERVRQVEKGALVSDLGWSPERDRILLDELFRRGIEESEFRKLMLIGEPAGTSLTDQQRHDRVYLVLRRLAAAGEAGFYEKWIREAVSDYVGLGDEGLPMLRAVVSGMTAAEGVDFSDVVISLMRDGELFDEGLRYFSFRGSTPQHLEAISGLEVPSKSESFKKHILERIERRILLAEKIKKNAKKP